MRSHHAPLLPATELAVSRAPAAAVGSSRVQSRISSSTWRLLGFVAFWAALADPFGVAEAMARADQQLAVRRGRQRHERGGPRRRADRHLAF